MVHLLTTDRTLSLYGNQIPEDFVYIDKITSPIFERKQRATAKDSFSWFDSKSFCAQRSPKFPFPQRTIVKEHSSNKNEQDIHQHDPEEQNIQHLDVLDYPPLSFSDISLELLTQLFNHRNLNLFVSQQKDPKEGPIGHLCAMVIFC